MVKIRTHAELADFFKSKGKDLTGFRNLSGLVSKQFSNFLNSYSKSYNKKYNRRGKLFLKSLERKPAKNKAYYKNLITYIHQNPVHHGFVEHASDWPFSSYPIFLSKKETQLQRKKALNWFGGRKAFMKFHQQLKEIRKEAFY